MKHKRSKWFVALLVICLLPLQGFAQNNQASEECCKGFSSVGKKAIPAVVFIRAQLMNSYEDGRPGSEQENPFDFFNDEFFHRFFGMPGQPGFRSSPQPQMAAGSGFIVSEDGKIVTNNHVVNGAREITVMLNNGEEVEGKLLGSDPRTDLAVIKIEKKNLPFLKFADSDKVEIGEWAIAIGSPFALRATMTVGVVSAKGRQDLNITDLGDFMQTDASINPGNSGGPLCNFQGDVIGINTAIYAKEGGGSVGIGFAIPSNMAKIVVEQISQNGQVKHSCLGVQLQTVDKETAEAFNLEKIEGVLVADVIKDSAAEKGGLKQGDIILEYNDSPIKNIGSFRNEIAFLEPGSKVKLKVLRNGKFETLTVVLALSQDGLSTAENVQIGIEVADVKTISPELARRWGYASLPQEGIVISRVKPGSLAEKAGLHPGLFVLQVNQKPLKTPGDFYEEVQKCQEKKHLVLLIRFPNGTTRFLTIRMK